MSESIPIGIEVHNLHRYFEDVKAVDGVSFHIPSGKLYSLLGPNGAGKSTVINMLSCNLKIQKGMAKIESLRECLSEFSSHRKPETSSCCP